MGPVGMLASWLWKRGLPYQFPCMVFYLCFASVILASLFYCSRLYLAGRISQSSWQPVLLIGVILLNPRILENDIFPLTIPMGAIAWRVLTDLTQSWKIALLSALTLMLVVNLLVQDMIPGIDTSNVGYNPVAISLVILCFLTGCGLLFKLGAPALDHPELVSEPAVVEASDATLN